MQSKAYCSFSNILYFELKFKQNPHILYNLTLSKGLATVIKVYMDFKDRSLPYAGEGLY